MPEKRETLEEIAKSEAAIERERAKAAAERAQAAEKLAKELPARFYQLAGEVRSAVARFNGAAAAEKRLTFHESPALAAHEENPNADLHCTVSRAGSELTLGLTALSRSGRPDAYLYEVSGFLGKDPIQLRVDGFVPKSGKLEYRIFMDLVRMGYGIDELGERVVRAVVRSDRNELRG